MGNAVTQAETTSHNQRSDPEARPASSGSLMIDVSCHVRGEHAWGKSDSRAEASQDSQLSSCVVGVDAYVLIGQVASPTHA